MSTIITNKEANEQGLKFYFTGKPCKNGHIAERQVSNRSCCMCLSENYKKWYSTGYSEYCSKNKNKIRKNASSWLQKNKDKANAKTAMRRALKIQRTPKWLDKEDQWLINEAYSLAQLRTNLFKTLWTVDHIVPLNGETVSGLHVPWNLQVIPSNLNYSKAAKWNWDSQNWK